jgi:hypothetical protein
MRAARPEAANGPDRRLWDVPEAESAAAGNKFTPIPHGAAGAQFFAW